MKSQVRYRQGHREYQLDLFARQWVSWETLPMDLHGAAIELISLLLEEALNWQEFATAEEKDDA